MEKNYTEENLCNLGEQLAYTVQKYKYPQIQPLQFLMSMLKIQTYERSIIYNNETLFKK